MKKHCIVLATPISQWSIPPREITLGSDEVHIWRSSLDITAAQSEMLSKALSLEERRRSEKYHYRLDRKRFIAARGILRNILARYIAAEPEELVFSYSSHGKPFLSNTFSSKGLTFNLSHANDLALYAVAINRRVGIDLECVRQEFQWKDVVERFFGPEEQAELQILPQRERCRAFFTYWTRKEAVLKAMGTGLTDDIKKVNVASETLRPGCLSQTDDSRNMSNDWALIDLDLSPGFVGALAVEGEGMFFQCWQWN